MSPTDTDNIFYSFDWLVPSSCLLRCTTLSKSLRLQSPLDLSQMIPLSVLPALLCLFPLLCLLLSLIALLSPTPSETIVFAGVDLCFITFFWFLFVLTVSNSGQDCLLLIYTMPRTVDLHSQFNLNSMKKKYVNRMETDFYPSR